jgi:uncharacterized protein YqeY
MSLLEQIETDIKDAMRSKDKDRLKTIRMFKSLLKEEMTKTGAQSISDNDALKILISYQKKLNKSIEQFLAGNRQDLADEVKSELVYFEAYLPEQLTEDAVRAIVKKAVEETGAATMKDMGKVMGHVVPQVTGKFDNKRVSGFVKEFLS